MSSGILKLFGGALLCVFVIVIVRRGNPEGALSAKMIFGVMMACACIASVSPVIDEIGEISSSLFAGDRYGQAVVILLKSLGIAMLTHICAGVCRDSGESSIAGYVELFGKIEIVLISLPLLRELIDTALKLLEM